MSDPGPHPGPPPDLGSRSPLLLDTRQSWFRTHSRARHPLQFNRDGRSRFDDPEGRYGVLYVAADEHGAFIETFGQSTGCNTVTMTSLAARSLTRIDPGRSLKLIDLASSGGMARLGADGRLCTGDRPVAQRWSHALRSHPCRPDGLYYPCRHDPARNACALFDHAAPDLKVGATAPWSARDHSALLGRVLDTYRFALIDE